ncbi:glycerophosphoryl diester phosphodiesterase membrane domain-containing protein [Secundilactobacillus muriivasis]
MTTFRFLGTLFRDYRRDWVAYTSLILGTNLTIAWIVIPLLTWFTAQALALGHIDYISYTNVTTLFAHPFVLIALLLLLLLTLALIYWQFSILMRGIYQIQSQHRLQVLELIQQTFSQRPELSLFSFCFFLGYFVLILPFAGLGLKTPLLAKVQIPDFIVSYLQANTWMALGLTLFYLVTLYLGLRLLFVLPKLVIQRQPLRQAVAASWQQTRWHTRHHFFQILALSIGVSVTAGAGYLIVIIAQTVIDAINQPLALTAAIVNLILIQLISQFIVLMSIYGLMRILLLDVVIPDRAVFSLMHHRRFPKFLTVGALLVIALSVVGFNVIYLNGLTVTKPLTISHRGVDSGNGVQNTIPALRKTSREHPDLVEMDLHETKDHQFVVMHDENLKALTGVNKAPYQLTLKQLTRLTAHENGYRAKVASFDAYLAAANQLHQRLLVEIKTTKHDSSDMLSRFITHYGTTLRQHHDQVHSLDYNVVTGLKKQDPKQFVSFILPYNFSFPKTDANAYTMEATTLTDSFVDEAQSQHQKVYAWTVNDDTTTQKMLFEGVDGIVTDHLKQLQGTIADNVSHPNYATRLMDYIIDAPTTNLPLD